MLYYPVMVRLSDRAKGYFEDLEPRRALFVDRDGILNVDSGYVGAVEDVVVNALAIDAIREANRSSIPVVVVSNQSGVGRGFFGWDAVTAVDDRVASILAESEAIVDLVIYAGADPTSGNDDPFRKPNPGMFRLAASVLPLDLRRSWMVGDKTSDVEAAGRAGLAGGVLIGDGAVDSLPSFRLGERFPTFRALAFADLASGFTHVLDELKFELSKEDFAHSRLDRCGSRS